MTISGRAYAFNHSDTGLAGAVIRVRELPGISAIADAKGDYELEVPDDTNVTPYIEPPAGYHQIDLQTFHTRGKPIENANFQTPRRRRVQRPRGAAAGPARRRRASRAMRDRHHRLGSQRPRGRLRDVSSANSPWSRWSDRAHNPFVTPPIYFNDEVIPDRSRSVTSGDGGVDLDRYAGGRLPRRGNEPSDSVCDLPRDLRAGANRQREPAVGPVRVEPGERPLGAGLVAGSVEDVKVTDRDDRSRIVARVEAAEPLRLKLSCAGQRFGVRGPLTSAPDIHAGRLSGSRMLSPPAGRD